MSLKEVFTKHLNQEFYVNWANDGSYILKNKDKGKPNVKLIEVGADYIAIFWADGLTIYVPFSRVVLHITS